MTNADIYPRRKWKIERITDSVCAYCNRKTMAAFCKCTENASQKLPRNRFEIDTDGMRQHVCEAMRKAEKEGEIAPFRVAQEGEYWVEIVEETTTTAEAKENEEMRTLYNAPHTDRDGRNWPIFGMTDGHLIRLLNYKAKRFDDIREKMCGTPTHSDPAIAALGKATSWKPEELVKSTMEVIDELSPFLQEALVRGGHVAQAATEAMRLITKRTKRVALPDEDKPIESTTEELDWDRPDDAAKLIEEID